jgi:predicted kinase
VGAGKSTTVVPLSKILKIPRISADEIRKELKQNGYDYSLLKDVSNKVCAHFLDLGYGLTLDQDLASQLEFVERIKAKYKLETIFIHVNPPEDFIIQKLRTYKGEQWLTTDQEKMVENYFNRKEAHKDIEKKIQFDYTMDTSLGSLDETIEKMALDIKEKYKSN